MKFLSFLKSLWAKLTKKPAVTPAEPPTTPTAGTPNPRPTASDIGLQSQKVKWKVDASKGTSGLPRTVVRWPSFLAKAFNITSGNSVTTIDGTRLEFQKFDQEKGNNRASYEIMQAANTFAPNCQVYLWVNNVAVAGFKKGNVTLYVDFDLPTNMEDVVP